MFNMKTLWLRWKGMLLLAILAVSLCYLLYSWHKNHPEVANCIPLSRADPDVQAISYYCNFPDLPVTGQEGDVATSDYVLEQVQLVIRHGDRYSLHDFPNYIKPKVSCQMQDYPLLHPHIPNLEKYEDTMKDNLKHLISVAKLMGYGLHPSQESCRSGSLTPVGAAQHIKNGAFLKETYSKWNLFEKNNWKKQVKLITTEKTRTFQSGIALIYGLLPVFDLTGIDIHTAMDSTMCVNRSTNVRYPCFCKAIMQYNDVISSTYGQTHPNMTFQPEYIEHSLKIAQVFGVSPQEVPRASHVMDVGMVHMCHGLPLPGHLEKCMDARSLHYVVDAINHNGKLHAHDGPYQRMARLRMLPLLSQIYEGMMEKIGGKSGHKLVIYSGHDSTIDPLLVTLNLSRGIWPMYASRITVELYSTRATNIPKTYYVRILYNGKDLTENVVFCKSLTSAGLCSLENFKKFLHDENGLSDLHLTDYQSECKRPFLNINNR